MPRDASGAWTRFGGYMLKQRQRQVIGPVGPKHLTGRSFDILSLLLSKPGEVVTKEAIVAAVWPGVAVEVRARVSAAGHSWDFLAGAAREPYRDPEPRERLKEGVRRALSF